LLNEKTPKVLSVRSAEKRYNMDICIHNLCHLFKKTSGEGQMSAPSKAGIYKLDNPARVKVSHQPGTELWA